MTRWLPLWVVLLGGCDSPVPFIRDLKYSPNAALAAKEATISGTVAYTDPDNDISQSVLELVQPSGAGERFPRMPIESVGQGVVGSVAFTLKFTPDVGGTWRFNVLLIDLADHESNRLAGIIKVN